MHRAERWSGKTEVSFFTADVYFTVIRLRSRANRQSGAKNSCSFTSHLHLHVPALGKVPFWLMAVSALVASNTTSLFRDITAQPATSAGENRTAKTVLPHFPSWGTCHLLEGGGGGGGGRAGANGGRVFKFYVAKKGRVTTNLSWALGRAIPFLANIAVHLK